MKLIFTMISVLIIFFISLGMVRYVRKRGEPVLGPRKKHVVGCGFFIIIVMYRFSYTSNITGIFVAAFILGYLLGTAYIDIKTLHIYTVFQVPIFMLSLIYFFMIEGQNVIKTIQVIVFLLFICLQKGIHLYGAGDGDILIAISFFISTYGDCPLYILLMHSLFSTLLFLLININKIDWKHFKLRSKTAYAPGIFLATVCCLVLNIQ